MAVVIDQMQVQVAEPPPARSVPSSATPLAPDPNRLLRLIHLAAERRARLATD